MNPRVLLVGFLLCLLTVPSVSALGTKYWDADIRPEKGATNQAITVMIRVANGEEPLGTTPRYAYVFYDGVPLAKAVVSPYTSSTGYYTYKWDIAITVPQTASATAYGEHEVLVRVEEMDGSASEKSYSYTVDDGVPVDTAIDYAKLWKTVPSSFYSEVWKYVPEGILSALKGEAGVDGRDGADAVIDYGVLAGLINWASVWDNVPSDILAEMKGAKGDAGAAGRDSDPMLVYAALLLSVLGNVGAWIIPWIKERKK